MCPAREAAPLATMLVLAIRIAGLVMLGILGTPPMRAQAQAPAAPVLEVASVKPVPASENAASFGGNRISMTATTLASAVRFAPMTYGDIKC